MTTNDWAVALMVCRGGLHRTHGAGRHGRVAVAAAPLRGSMTEMSRSQSRAEYGRFAHLFVGGIEWLLSQWQALTGGGETDLHSHASSGGGSGGLVSVDVPISEAELKNLHVVSKTLIAAQGSGTVVEPLQITVERLAGTAYTVPGGNYFELGWPDGVAGQSLVAFDPTRLLGSFSSGARGFVQLAPSVGSNYWANPDTVVNTFDDKANQPFGVALDSAVTDGTGGLIMHILYRVL
jgi:hypothetical protein